LSDADIWILVEALLGIDPDVGQPTLAELVLKLFEIMSAFFFVEESVGQRLVHGVTLVVVDNQTVLRVPRGKIKRRER